MPQATPRTDSRAQVLELPLAGRECEVRGFARAGADAPADSPLATAQIVFSAGAAVRRYDWYRERFYNEELVVSAKAIRLQRLKRGISLLDTHDSYRLRSVLGICDMPEIDDGKTAQCRATFSRREEVAGYVQDVADGVIRHVSVGYVRHKVEMIPPATEGGTWVYRVTDWEPHENSLVPIPADMDSHVVRSAGGKPEGVPEGKQLRTYQCEFVEAEQQLADAGLATETRNMPTAGSPAEPNPTREERTMPTPADQTLAAGQTPAEAAAAQAAAVTAERTRAADIQALCQRHGAADKAADYIAQGKSVHDVRAAILDDMATRSEAQGNGQRNVSIQTLGDEGVTYRAGLEEALSNRVDAKAKLGDNGRQFRGMSLIEIGRDFLARHNVNTRGMSKLEVASQMLNYRSGGMMGTSDFANLLANVANKRLRSSYVENMPSYQRWARRAPNAPDFKAMTIVNLAGAPDLLKVNEHGEFTVGAMTDGKETYSMLTYGRIVPFTRQAIVNDDLRGFDRLIGAFGNSSARLENRIVYAILTANAALNDTGLLFNTTAVTTPGGHANLASANAAIALASLNIGRTQMRLQKGLQSEELNIAPKFLIAPATQEMLAYQYTSNAFVPNAQSSVNEFAAGGRSSLEVVIDAVLDGNSTTAWYLAADSAQVDTVEYCFLDGAEGPMVESEVGFEIDGIAYKCREDFAAKAIDFRGLWKNIGA